MKKSHFNRNVTSNSTQGFLGLPVSGGIMGGLIFLPCASLYFLPVHTFSLSVNAHTQTLIKILLFFLLQAWNHDVLTVF